MKKITIVWTITLIIIIGGLTVIGFKIKENKIDNIMEKSLVEETEKYLGLYTNLYPTLGNFTKITYEELVDKEYTPVLDKGCTGYVIVKNTNMGFTYKGYIKCPEYVTEGYEE